MKHLRFSVFLCTLLVCTFANALDFEVDGINYSTTADDAVTVTGWNKNYTDNLVLYGTVTYDGTEYNVVSIGAGTFNGCANLTSVGDLPACISIGDGAFWGCTNLTSVGDLPACISIGNNAFQNSGKLTSVGDLSACKLIGTATFSNCGSLTSIELSACTSIGGSAFSGCSSLASVGNISACTSIGDHAFEDCKSLTSITIPASVKDISVDTFTGCDGLVSIIVTDGNTIYDSRNNCNAIIETASNTLIVGCKGTSIPNGITRIGDYAFFGSSVTSINIPSSVISIGNNAFDSCRELASITIPNSITSLGREVFRCCI